MSQFKFNMASQEWSDSACIKQLGVLIPDNLMNTRAMVSDPFGLPTLAVVARKRNTEVSYRFEKRVSVNATVADLISEIQHSVLKIEKDMNKA